MSKISLCDPCHAFLKGQWIPGSYLNTYTHHPHGRSFNSALELDCAICVRLYAAFVSLYIGFYGGVGPTTFGRPSISANCVTMTFRCENSYVRLQMSPQSSTPESHHNAIFLNNRDAMSLDFLMAQYRQCIEHHTMCSKAAQDHSFRPTRLIDVGTISNASVHLCEHELIPTSAPYVSLSHCWGGVSPTTLTTTSAASLKQGVLISSLPRTFQEAIAVTRSFNHRYLWIDSLCIIQDDIEDWRRESVMMRDVYSNASVCIAATMAQDGNGGLFADKGPGGLNSVQVNMVWPDDILPAAYPRKDTYWLSCYRIDTWPGVESAPLNSRAWVCQERYLSSRIMHFARELVLWECREKVESETNPYTSLHHMDPEIQGPDSQPLRTFIGFRRRSRLENSAKGAEFDKIGADRSSDVDFYYNWCQFRAVYTKCGLTKGDDVLTALQGIVQDVKEILNITMVAGMWERYMISELCWYNLMWETSCRPPPPHSPSWSWISSNKPIYSKGELSQYSEPLRHSMASVSSIQVGTTPSADFGCTSILLKCRLIPVSIDYQPILGSRKITLDTESFVRCWEHAFLFFKDETAIVTRTHPHLQHYFLMLRFIANEDHFTEGILVQPCDHRPRSFTRIGYWYFRDWKTAANWNMQDVYKSMEEQTIELV